MAFVPQGFLSALPSDHREPRLRAALAENDILQVGANLEPRSMDLFHGPTARERSTKLFLRNPPRSLGAWLLVAETEQNELLQRYRRDEPIGDECPLKRALAGDDRG